MYRKYKDDNYEFEYYETTYETKTSPETEYLRHIYYKELIEHLNSVLIEERITLKSSNKKNKQIICDNLAMFIALNLLEKKHLVDPLIPHNAKKNKTLINTLVFLGGITKERAGEVFKKFQLTVKLNQIIKKIQNRQTIEVIVVKIKHPVVFKYKYKNVEVICPLPLYHKLKKRYTGDKLQLDATIFCLLLRYKTFGGNSHQFSMEIEFKNALRKKYNIDFECFASAINVHYNKYCSLFYDIERHFGSFGNFYLVKYTKGFYIANPPYETILLEKMVEKFISSCQESKKSLSISFGLPNWGAYERFIPLEIVRDSEYKTYFRCMEKGEVLWYDSLTGKGIKIPSHCRTVVQNNRGKIEYNMENFDTLVEKYWIYKK